MKKKIYLLHSGIVKILKLPPVTHQHNLVSSDLDSNYHFQTLPRRFSNSMKNYFSDPLIWSSSFLSPILDWKNVFFQSLMAAAKISGLTFERPFPPVCVVKQRLSEANAALFSIHLPFVIHGWKLWVTESNFFYGVTRESTQSKRKLRNFLLCPAMNLSFWISL